MATEEEQREAFAVHGSRAVLALRSRGVLPMIAGGAGPPAVTSGTLVARYDASQLGLADGASIATWTDLSGNGYNATATGTAQPTFRVNIQNGLAAVQFNGSSNYMDAAGVTLNQPDTVFIVAQTTTGTGQTEVFDGITSRQSVLNDNSTGPQQLGTYAQGALSDAAVAWGTSWRLVTVIFNGASSVARMDRVTYALATSPGTSSLSGLRIGAYNTSGAAAWPGYMGELLFYQGGLSTADMQSVEGYLYSKWFVATPVLPPRLMTWPQAMFRSAYR